MVLMGGATTHFRIMCEIFGEHPAAIDEDRYLTAAADLAAALLSNQGDQQ